MQIGAFVDIGMHHDALIHISPLANEFVQGPNKVISVGDIVKVKVLDLNVPETEFPPPENTELQSSSVVPHEEHCNKTPYE